MTTATTWGSAKAPASGNKDIQRLDFKGISEAQIRLVGVLIPRYTYWVVTKEGKKRSIECLSFNRETQAFDASLQDPIKEIDPEIYGNGQGEKPGFGYVTHVIDRKDNTLKLFDPIKKTVFDKIVALAAKPAYGDPADPIKGYDLTISKKKTGPLPQNVAYDVVPSDRSTSPLSPAELELELYDLEKLFKRPTYDEQKRWLLENTTYFLGAAGEEGKAESAKDI
jgi:hypothetical protein